jgi:hypothetical protein
MVTAMPALEGRHLPSLCDTFAGRMVVFAGDSMSSQHFNAFACWLWLEMCGGGGGGAPLYTVSTVAVPLVPPARPTQAGARQATARYAAHSHGQAEASQSTARCVRFRRSLPMQRHRLLRFYQRGRLSSLNSRHAGQALGSAGLAGRTSCARHERGPPPVRPALSRAPQAGLASPRRAPDGTRRRAGHGACCTCLSSQRVSEGGGARSAVGGAAGIARPCHRSRDAYLARDEPAALCDARWRLPHLVSTRLAQVCAPRGTFAVGGSKPAPRSPRYPCATRLEYERSPLVPAPRAQDPAHPQPWWRRLHPLLRAGRRGHVGASPRGARVFAWPRRPSWRPSSEG